MFRRKWTWLRDGINPPAGWGTEERLYKEINMCYQFVDLAMTKGDRSTVVQCKRYKNRANPAVVRELYGTLTAIGAHDAILVCTGGFTSGVYNFVRDKPIQLIDMDGILALQNLTVETYGFYDSNSTQ